MTPTAAYIATIKKSGTATTMTAEAMGNVTGNTYQITSSAKRVIDINTPLTFYNNAVAISASDILTVDYFLGKVTFTGSKSGPITVTGKYMPMAVVAQAKSVNFNLSSAVLDITDFVNAQSTGGRHTKKAGLLDASVTIARFSDALTTFKTLLTNRTPLVLELRPGGSGAAFRGWFLVESIADTGEINGVNEEQVTFQLKGNNQVLKTFSYS